MKWVETLNSLSVDIILIIAGVLFLVMSVANKVSGSLEIPESRKKQALVLGSVLLSMGVAYNLMARTESVDCPSHDMSWTELTSQQQSLWETLGWNARAWDNDEAPETDGKPFDELTAEQQNAAQALGFSRDAWNTCE